MVIVQNLPTDKSVKNIYVHHEFKTCTCIIIMGVILAGVKFGDFEAIEYAINFSISLFSR